MSNGNKRLVLIAGESATGKSASLKDMRHQERGIYLGCEAGKDLPFRSNFNEQIVTDPYFVHQVFDLVNPGGPDNANADYVIIDSVTFLMDMFESVYVVGSANTMAAWGAYQQFFKTLMQDKVANSDKAVIMTAHTRRDLDEVKGEYITKVPVKGALQNEGIEAFFSTVVACKRMRIKEIEKYESDILRITDEEKEDGFKYVFQTRITKETTGERIRSPMGLFARNQPFMDNNAQLLLDHLHSFYN